MKSYGSFEVVDIKEVEVPESKYILSQLNEIKGLLAKNSLSVRMPNQTISELRNSRTYKIAINTAGKEYLKNPANFIEKLQHYNITLVSLNRFADTVEIHLSASAEALLPPLEWLENQINGELGS